MSNTHLGLELLQEISVPRFPYPLTYICIFTSKQWKEEFSSLWQPPFHSPNPVAGSHPPLLNRINFSFLFCLLSLASLKIIPFIHVCVFILSGYCSKLLHWCCVKAKIISMTCPLSPHSPNQNLEISNINFYLYSQASDSGVAALSFSFWDIS